MINKRSNILDLQFDKKEMEKYNISRNNIIGFIEKYISHTVNLTRYGHSKMYSVDIVENCYYEDDRTIEINITLYPY
jgi:hypothetical protein